MCVSCGITYEYFREFIEKVFSQDISENDYRDSLLGVVRVENIFKLFREVFEKVVGQDIFEDAFGYLRS